MPPNPNAKRPPKPSPPHPPAAPRPPSTPHSPSTPPTARQLEVYAFLFDHVRRLGYQPSMREIQAHFGFASANAVHNHLLRLHNKGWVAMAKDESRAIRLIRCPDGRPFRGFTEV